MKINRWTALTAALLLLLLPTGQVDAGSRAAGQPPAAARADKYLRLDEHFQRTVDAGEMAGIVLLVAQHGRVVHLSALGSADLGAKRAMRTDTIFRLYSMTKPITATALMMLYEEGKFHLDDPISKYIPEFAGMRVLRAPDASIEDTVPATRAPTIHDLFRHTAGFGHGLDAKHSAVDRAYSEADIFNLDVPLSEMMTRLARIPLHCQPGTQFEYSLGQDVQARLIEILSGMSFDRFLQTRLFGPLGMKDTGFWVKPQATDRLSAVHWSKDGTLVSCDASHGCPPPDLFILERKNIDSYRDPHAHTGGSYGLASTAEDYWRFSQMMANDGSLNGIRVLSPATVHFMTQNHLGSVVIPPSPGTPPGTGWGLGFATVEDGPASGTLIPEGSFYWAGAANTLFWVDPKNDLVVVAMTQHLAAPTVSWPSLREEIAAIVYAGDVTRDDEPGQLCDNRRRCKKH